MLLLTVLSCVILLASSAPPALPQRFTCAANATSPQMGGLVATGTLYMDYANRGARTDFNSPPFSLVGTAVATPNPTSQTVIGYLVTAGACGGSTPPIPFNQIPPFSLPINSTYIGKSTVNGVPCQQWNVTNFQIMPQVAISGAVYLQAASPFMIVQMVSNEQGSDVFINLYGCTYSPIPASVFGKPSPC